jgi:hypothetical protein
MKRIMVWSPFAKNKKAREIETSRAFGSRRLLCELLCCERAHATTAEAGGKVATTTAALLANHHNSHNATLGDIMSISNRRGGVLI